MPVLTAVLVGAAIAFLAPQLVFWMRPALQPAFALTMLAVGTLVRPEQARAFARAPLRPLSGLAGQYTIMPLTAGAISLLFDDPQVRTAACALPFGARLNARGDGPEGAQTAFPGG